MPEDRMMLAIGRIERALARLETMDGNARSKGGSDSAALEQRHMRLRQETQAVVDDLDQLLQRMVH